MKILLITVIFCFIVSVNMSAAYKPRDHSGILWQKGLVHAEYTYSAGYDRAGYPVDFGREKKSLNRERLNASVTARESIREKIAVLVSGIKLTGTQTLSEYVKSSPEAGEALSDVLDDKIRIKETPGDFFSSKALAELKISELIRALQFEFPGDEIPVPEDKAVPTRYTSLIIDARNSGVSPMLLPSVYDEDGLEIYGRNFIDPVYAVKEGIVSYCYSENEAEKHRKAGAHPYIAPAIRVIDGNPVIPHKDIRRILSDSSNIKNLKKCRVIFIIDAGRSK